MPETRTILIIEDSPTQALHLQGLLEQNGLQVMCAAAGLPGLAMARRARPDLIVLDVQLPDMDGFAVAEQLKSGADTWDLPVIMLTRLDDSHAVIQGLQSGVTDYIPKDAFADAVLLETLRQMGLIQS